MKAVYRSEIDTWLLVVLLAAMAVMVVASIAVIAHWEPGSALALASTVGGIVLVAWMLLGTDYTIEPDRLVVRCGPLRWRIPLSDIHAVTPTHDAFSAPALSLDRLRIDYGRGRSVMISPRDRTRFIAALDARRARVSG